MKTRISSLLLVCLIIASTAHLRAATFVVSDLGGAGPGTLRQAILDANANSGADTITFSVNGTIAISNQLPNIIGATTVTGPGTNLLTISGSKKYCIFKFTGGNTNAISDLRIADGLVDGFFSTRTSGALTNACGIVNDGYMSLLRCVLQNCKAELSWGAGICNSNDLTLQGCVLANCGAMPFGDQSGGGIFNFGTLRIKDSTFIGCGGSERCSGGGIYSPTTNSLVHLTNSRFTNCGSGNGDGGAIGCYGQLILEDTYISGGGGYWAGGISASSLMMTNSTVTGCKARGGGGLHIYSGVFVGCTISGNQAWDAWGGGGIWASGNLAMYNCTVSSNLITTSLGSGQAAALQITGGSVLANHCTIISNTGPQGIEISAPYPLTAANSIIGNVTGTVNSQGQNLIVNTNGTIITNNVGGNIYNIDPHLGPLQNNGGPTWTHALLPGSTAIDNADSGGLNTDQRGATRSTTADIGAYEVVTVTPPNLQIALTDPTHVTLSWSSAPGPVVLQQNPGFLSGDWADVSATPADDGITTSLTLPSSSDGKFYRLRSP